MPRMRTAAKVHEIIMEQDPASEVTLHYIRHLIATEAVPVTYVGRKKLVDADQVIAYIAWEPTAVYHRAVSRIWAGEEG